MPISAEQWRVKTGMINASRGFRQHSIKPPQSLCDLPIPPPPPSDWKGYSLALTLLCLPLLYKIYALGVAVMMYLVRGENYGLVAQDSYGMTDAHLHHGHWSGVLLLLLTITSYLTMTLAAFLMSVHEYREQNKHQLVLTHPLHHLKFLCWFNMEGGAGGGLKMVPKIVNGCVYATLVMDPPSTLQCVRTSVKTENRKATGISVTFVSFVLQLSTIALAMLLLLGGDVERNPGPSLDVDDIKTLVNELKSATSKYHNIGLQLGVKPEKIEIIEQDYSHSERRLHEILLFWLRGNTDVEVCWESIVNALIKVDRKTLAKELMEKYCPNEKEKLFCSEAMSTGSDHVHVAATHTTQQHGGKISIPVLDTSLLDDVQKQRCQKLSKEMDKLSERFQDLIDSISASLEQREIPISKIVMRIRAFQAFEPVYATDDSLSIFEHRMTELRNAKSVDDIMFIIGAYSSFFNYHLVERIIKSLGTAEDKKKLSDYEEEFRLFAECMVYECPTRFQGPADEQTQRTFMVKVNDTFENCTLSHLERFINKLSEVLKLSEGTLSLESIRRGCLELTLQAPLFVYQSIFPLTSDQERALAALGVIKISAGDYQYPHSQDEGDNDDNGKPDDGSGPGGGHSDSGIDTLTAILSELSEHSDEVASINSWDPYDIDYHFENKSRKLTQPNKEITALNIASRQGNLDYVKMLVNSGMFKPSQRDEEGYTAVHYAVRGGQLDVVKYFIEEQQCNPSDVGAFGETLLHLACRRGDIETVKYLVVDQKVDPMCEPDKEYGITPFHSACSGGNIDIVRLLVKEMSAYVSIKEMVEDQTKDGNTCIHLAAMCGHLTVVKYFMSELECDPNIRGQYGMTPLHCAAFKGHVDIVNYFINTVQCDPSLTDDWKRTPLFLAAGSKNLEAVKFLSLFKKDSNPLSRDIYGNTPLHLSGISGEVKIAKYFISELKCDPNAKNKDGVTPLHAAAGNGHVQVMEYFIEEKICDPSAKTKLGKTPLFHAADNGQLNVVKFLTTKYHCSPLDKSLGSTPLHIAAANGHIDVVKFLVSELKCDPNLLGHKGSTPLHAAALKGHVEVMKFLINDRNCVCSPKTDSGLTPLHYAANEGHLDAVKLLTVDHHCDPNCRDSTQSTPLHYAVRARQNEVIDFFINDLNCDPNTVGPLGYTPLHIAAESGNLETVKVLLKHKECSPTTVLHDDGTTPLHMAAHDGHLNIVKFLISDYSCDQSAHSEEGITPLHIAAHGGHVQVMKYLVIDKQCDPSQLDNAKFTPLHYAAKMGHLEALKFLTVDENCDPYCRDQNANTPLHLAAFNGHVDVVKFLVSELKCSPRVTNNYRLTPCQLAMISGHNEIVKYLKNAVIQMYTPKAISTTLNEGDDPIQSIHYFPPFSKLPKGREFKEYYKQRDAVNWLFMAEIIDNEFSQDSDPDYYNVTLVRDRSGEDILIYFHYESTDETFDFSTLKKGHTLIVQQATQYDSKTCDISTEIPSLCIVIMSTLLVIPCSMKDLFTLSELYYKRKDTQCWSCGKTQTGDTSSSPELNEKPVGKPVDVLKKCSACKVARYCSKECQATDWKTRHRRLCKVIPHFMKLTQL